VYPILFLVRSANQAAAQAHYFRARFPYAIANFQSRNIALLQSNLVAFLLTNDFLSLIDVVSDAVEVRCFAQAEHIWKRREAEAQSIIDALPDAMARIKYVGHRDVISAGIVRTAIGECSDRRLILCGIKFLPAKGAWSGKDEAWMSTAYFVGVTELSRLLKRGKIVPILRTSKL